MNRWKTHCSSRGASSAARTRDQTKSFFPKYPHLRHALLIILVLCVCACVAWWQHVLRTPTQKLVIKLHDTEQRFVSEALHEILLVPDKLSPRSPEDTKESIEEMCERYVKDKCGNCGTAAKKGPEAASAKREGPAAVKNEGGVLGDDQPRGGGRGGVGKGAKDGEFDVVRKLDQLELPVQEIWAARRRDWQEDGEIRGVGRTLSVDAAYRRNVDLLRNEKPLTRLANFKNPCFKEDPRETTLCRVRDFATLGPLPKGGKREVLPKVKLHLSCLPYFIVAGMPQSGAADVLNLLGHHPDVRISQPMQSKWMESVRFAHHCASAKTYLDFFRATTLQLNASLAKHGSHNLIMGELAEDILWDNHVWPALPGNEGQLEPRYTNVDYLYRINPDVKVVVILRDPSDRLYEEYKKDAVRLKFKPSAEDFNTRVQWKLDVLKTCLQTEPVRTCVYDGLQDSSQQAVRIRSGMYHVLLQDWLRVFSRDHVHVINYDTWHDNMKEELARLIQFLKITDASDDGLDEMLKGARRDAYSNPGIHGQSAEGGPQQQQQQQQQQQFAAEMLSETRQMLDNFYKPLNKFVATLLEDEGFLWTKEYKRV